MSQNTFYHLAPSASREIILEEGLVPWSPGRPHTFDGMTPKPYVYLWSSLDKAVEWANRFVNMYPEGKGDIWEANIIPSKVSIDNRLDSAWVIKETIPSSNITLAKEVDFRDTAIHHGYCPDCDSPWDKETDSCLECDPPESY